MKNKVGKCFVLNTLALALVGVWGCDTVAADPPQTAGVKAMIAKKATFAGGCFWCMEPPFEKLHGVISVVSGYTGGHKTDPTYQEVSGGATGHLEAIQVDFDPSRISYDRLLEVFWRQIDPTDTCGQFADRGSQYTTAIFVHDEEQKRLAEASRAALAASGRFDKPIVTAIRQFERFYPAEDYHQDYYRKQPVHYNAYRIGSGRHGFIEKMWCESRENKENKESKKNKKSDNKHAAADDEILKKKLSPLQFHVARENGTEPPFANAFWNNKKEGIYVDNVSGEPLFSSVHKFDSGTGWPSFTQPIEPDNIVKKRDTSHGMVRTEVRSRTGDSHLGHLFEDGPAPTGLRYCINSASLRFIPKERLSEEGYGDYLRLFKANGVQ